MGKFDEAHKQDIDSGNAWAMIGLIRALKQQGILNTPEGDAQIEKLGSMMPMFNGQREKEEEEREQKRLARIARKAEIEIERTRPEVSQLNKKQQAKAIKEWEARTNQAALF